MGNETKWADVAHYYQFSDIEIQLPCGNRKFKGMTNQISGDSNHKKAFYLDAGGYFTRSTDANVSQYRPILRHRDDMTEAEAREIWEIHFGKAYEIGPFNELEEPCKDEILNSATYGTRNRLNTELMLGNSLTLHWFISRGFDVFGLIESGQAIRKEMGNGNS